MKDIWEIFKSSLRGFDSPSQLALGVAFGLVIGLLPKDSLLPYMIGVVAVLTNANLATLIVSGLVFSWAGLFLDPITHKTGLWVLTSDSLETFWARLYQFPIVPWTRFENTIVMGSLVVGLLFSIPIYAVSRQLFSRYGDTFFNLVFKNRFSSWLIGPSETTRLQES